MTTASKQSVYVVVEMMPEHLRESHRKAGNSGVWPHNGAERYVASLRVAERDVADDPEWTRIVREATSEEAAEAEG